VSFLLDTDTCSAYLKGNRLVSNKMMQYAGRLAISAATAGELFTWALRAKAPPSRLHGVTDLLKDVTLLVVDEQVARQFGEIRAKLIDQGITVGEMDLLIASTALLHGLTLVTHNTADFTKVPGLPLDDWLIP
jgi:predicted nucleic acid-binding protein